MTHAGRPTAVGLGVLAVGLALMAMVQLQWRSVPRPLFDGVVVSEPYRFLHPGPGQAGDPTSYSDTQKLRKGEPPLVAGYTSESVPQVQMFSQAPGAITLTPGARRMTTTIRPVERPPVPVAGRLVGNAYEILVTDGAGQVATMVPGKSITLALRAPAGVGGATIELFADGAWQDLHAEPSGLPDIWVVSDFPQFGIFAVVVPSPSASAAVTPGASIVAPATLLPTAVPLPPTAGADITPGASIIASVSPSATAAAPSPGGDPGAPGILLVAVAVGLVGVVVAGVMLVRRRPS